MTVKTRDPNDKYILFSFLGFFGFIFLVNGFFVYTALKTQTGVITEQAYEKGLGYNKTLKEAKSQPVLQDKVSYKSPILRWTLEDSHGKPVVNAKITGRVIRPVQDGHDFDIYFVSKGEGVYESSIILPMKGQWIVNLESQWTQNNQTKAYKTVYPLIER